MEIDIYKWKTKLSRRGCKKSKKMSLEIVMGPMFSGKSSYIYSIVKRYRALNIPVLVIKPSIDVRYSADPEVVTHDGVRFDCVTSGIELTTNVLGANKYDVVVIEEAQFFTNLVKCVTALVETYGKNVVVVGLDGDSNRKPFGELLQCIPLADKVTKLNALCAKCKDGTPALFTYRTAKEESQVFVGGAQEYKPLCRACYTNAP